MGDRRRLRRTLHLGDQHLRFGNIRQPALQTDSQTAMPGHEQQQAEAVEQGMEQRQLEQGVVAQAEPGGDLPGQRRQGRNQQDGQPPRTQVEQHMTEGQTLAGARAAQRAEHGGDGGADVGTDGQRKGLLEADLPARQGSQGQHQRRMAGLQQHRCQQAGADEQQGAEQPRHPDAGRIQPGGGAGETALHQIDAEEQQADAEQQPTDALRPRAVEAEQDADHRQRQGQGAQAGTLPGQRQQPDAAGGAQIGAENDAQPRRQADQPGAEEGDGQQGHQRAGLHQRGGQDAETETLPDPIGSLGQNPLQPAAGQHAQAFLQALHAEQEQRQATGQLGPACAEPERHQQRRHQQPDHHFIRRMPGQDVPPLSAREPAAAVVHYS
ncbi:hypothetical protein D3C78_571090 [compost metagenome]